MQKRKIAILTALVLMMVTCHSSFAFAEANEQPAINGNQLQVLSLDQDNNEQHLIVSENGIVTDINTTTTEDTVKTILQNQETGEVSYFIVDKNNNTLYSSITRETIDIGEEVQNIKAAYAKASKPPATKTLKISYNKIYKALDKTATKTTIASLILTFVTAALPFPVLTTVALLINSIDQFYFFQCFSNQDCQKFVPG